MIVPAITVNISFEPFTKGIDNTDADSVQPAGNLIAVAVELAP